MRSFTSAELRACKSLRDAYRLTVQLSGRQRKAIEIDTGISTAHMSRILEGSRNLPADRFQTFYESCGNVFALQWQMYQLGFEIRRREFSIEEKAELFDELMRQTG